MNACPDCACPCAFNGVTVNCVPLTCTPETESAPHPRATGSGTVLRRVRSTRRWQGGKTAHRLRRLRESWYTPLPPEPACRRSWSASIPVPSIRRTQRVQRAQEPSRPSLLHAVTRQNKYASNSSGIVAFTRFHALYDPDSGCDKEYRFWIQVRVPSVLSYRMQ